MRYIFAIFLVTIFPLTILATGQFPEKLILNGDTVDMMSEPLEAYLRLHEPRNDISPALGQPCHTGLWRGYVGYWEIKDNKLLLIDVYECGDKSKSLKSKLFSDNDKEIFANWYSGELFIPKGNLIVDFQFAYEKIFEKELILKVENGVVKEYNEYSNGVEKNENRISRDRQTVLNEIYKNINWSEIKKFSNIEFEVELKIDSTGKIHFVNLSKIEKIRKEYKLTNLNQKEKDYEAIIKNSISSFKLVKRFYYRGKSIDGNDSFIIVFNKRNKYSQ